MDLKTYKTKPVCIRAVILTEGNAEEVASWARGTVQRTPQDQGGAVVTVLIPTLEGLMTANVGDYVIEGTRGEVYPCKPQPFDDKYEEAEYE